jgi:hypothetical protein
MTAELKRKGVSPYGIACHLLSDTFAREMVISYFDRVIMRGDYYTHREAVERVKARRFRGGKEERLIDALNLISQQRSVHGAKEALRHEGGDLTRFNQALHELANAGINPVTIPKSFGIRHIPNPLEAFFSMERVGQSSLERLEDYITDSRKKGKQRRK